MELFKQNMGLSPTCLGLGRQFKSTGKRILAVVQEKDSSSKVCDSNFKGMSLQVQTKFY